VLPFSRFASYFIELAAQGNLRKAAEVLHVSASAIHRQIVQAEQELETELFERLPTGMKLTAAGELLLGDLQRWRKEHTRTLERVGDLRGLRRGHVSIALIDALGEGFLPRLLAELGREYPGFSYDLRVVRNRVASELVAAAEVDFGLLLDPVEHGNLEIRAAIDVPVGAVLPPGHALAGAPSLAMSQLLDERLLVPAAPLVIEERTRSLYTRHGVDPKRVTTCNDTRLIRSLIRDGGGVGVLSLIDVAHDLEQGLLAFVPLHGWQARPLQLTVCTAPRRQPSRAAQLVLARTVEALQGLPERLAGKSGKSARRKSASTDK
jgi:DNA-binding transcriptional LysR family regulator